MADGDIAVVLILAVTAAIGVPVWLVRRHRRRAEAARWEGMSARFGGVIESNRHSDRSMTATIDGRAVTVRHRRMKGRYEGHFNTAVDARCDDAGPFQMSLVPQSIAEQPADAHTDDPDFDAGFRCHTNDPHFARAWLCEPVRRAVRDAPRFSFALEDGRIRARFEHTTGSLARLDPFAPANIAEIAGGLEAVAELARGGDHLRTRWEELARALGGALTHDDELMHLELPEQPSPLSVAVEIAGEIRVTAVRVRLLGSRGETLEICHADDRELPELARVDVDAGSWPAGMVVASSEPARTALRIDGSLVAALSQLMPAEVRSDGSELAVILAGVEADRFRIERAMAIARTLAESRATAYR